MQTSKLVNQEYNFLNPILFPKLIRLGKMYDGGYVVPEELIKNSDGLISFGYGYDPAFEYDYIKYTNKTVKIFDHTCNSYDLLKSFLKYLKRFFLFKKNFCDVKFHYRNLAKHINFINNKKVTFYKKKIVADNKDKISPIETNINKIFLNIDLKNIIVKCDIEGSEYEIIDDLLKYYEK